MRKYIRQIHFCMLVKIRPYCELKSAKFMMPATTSMGVLFDGEVAGRLLNLRVPWKWIREVLGRGPYEIFLAAADEELGIARGPDEPEGVSSFFYLIYEVCGFVDPVYEKDGSVMLICGETTKRFNPGS